MLRKLVLMPQLRSMRFKIVNILVSWIGVKVWKKTLFCQINHFMGRYAQRMYKVAQFINLCSAIIASKLFYSIQNLCDFKSLIYVQEIDILQPYRHKCHIDI